MAAQARPRAVWSGGGGAWRVPEEKRENDAVQFDSLVQGIRENGLNGLKGYFTAFSVGSHEDPALPGIEIDLDLQCMMPPRPF